MAEQLLDRILKEIRQRMNESRAAYEESQRLEAALSALGPSDDNAPSPRARRPRARSTRATRSRAPRGENLRRIREQVEQRPGASAGEIASATGIARATVASTLGKLARDGELVKADLPSGRVGYRLATTPPPTAGAGAETTPQSTPDPEAATEAAPNGGTAQPKSEAKPRRGAAPKSRAKSASKRTTRSRSKATPGPRRKAASKPAPPATLEVEARAAAADKVVAGDAPSKTDAT